MYNILNRLKEGLLILDLRGEVVFINVALLQMLNYFKYEWLGTTIKTYIDNYEEVIFTSDEEYAEYEDLYEDEYEYEYEEVDDEDEYEYEYEEVEYEEIDDEDNEKYRNEENNNDEYYEDSEEITETQPKQKPQRLRNQKGSYINEPYNNSLNDNHEDINFDNSEIGSMKNLLMPRQIKKV